MEDCDKIELGGGQRTKVTINSRLLDCLLEWGKEAMQEAEKEGLSFEQTVCFLIDQVIDDRVHYRI